MRNLKPLFLGEIQRLQRYHIIAASLVVAVIWIGVLHFTDVEDVTSIFPLLLFLDATTMSVTLIGVSMFFEREEHTLKALFVSPITKEEYMVSKIIGNIVSNLQTLVLLYLYARIFKEINLNVFLLVFYVIIISVFHSMIGFLLAYRSKSFTELLTGVVKYMFLFLIPVVLEQVGVITGELVSNLLYLLPTKAALLLLNSTTNGVETWEVVYGVLYLIALSLILGGVIKKGFDAFVAKESGI